MPKNEAPLSLLESYLPEGSLPFVYNYLKEYKVHLTISKSRKTVLGDYRHATRVKSHRISVNGNLNRYAFLITLIHELAHLVTFTQYGNTVYAHGKEWKLVYRKLLTGFLIARLFPDDIRNALERSLHNLPASSCADEALMRILKNYDVVKTGLVMIEDLGEGVLFVIEGGRVFKKGTVLRKRIQCTEVSTGRIYVFSPIFEVKEIKSN